MIDEALYQQATDELNSDRRRPHVWARACALANDDHDEARYLYTNLRVEELLAEGAGRDGGADADDDDDDADAGTHRELELEPLEPAGFGAREPDGDDDVVSVRAGSTTRSEPLLPDTPDGDAERPASEHGRAVLDLDADGPLDLDPTEVQRLNESSAGAVSAIDGRHLPDVADGAHDAAGPGAREDEGDDTRRLEPGETPERAPTPTDDAADVAGASGADDATPAANVDIGGATSDVGATTHDGTDAAAAFWEEIDEDARALAVTRRAADDRDDGGATDSLEPASASGGTPSSGALDDLDWLDEAYREERRTLAETPATDTDPDDDPDELTRELRRQAEELPGGRGTGAIIPHDDPIVHGRGAAEDGAPFSADTGLPTGDAPPVGRTGPARDADEGDGTLGDVEDAAARREADGRDDVVAEVAAVGGTVAAAGGVLSGTASSGAFAAGDEPLELVDAGAGDEEYAVFAHRRGDRWQAVRQGGSWAATLFTLPWLVYRHLIGTALLYALLAVAVIGGLLVTGSAWQEAGAAAALATKVATIGFALLAVAGLFVVPFRSANHWREDKLERRGFELVAYVRARGAERALELARQARGAPS